MVVEQMWLDSSKYPEADGRFGLTELQWIQYQLDNSACVEDVIASDSLLRISFTSTAPLHFLVADKQGNVSTVEYINGQMIVHNGNTLPYAALANDSYQESVEYAKNFIGLGGNDSIPETVSSIDRFSRAAYMISNCPDKKDMIEYSFDILKLVSQRERQHNGALFMI